MQKSKKAALLSLVAFVAIVSGSSAYAQTEAPLTDSQFNIVIVASVVGAIIAPIIGFATQENTDTTKATPFNWRQYALSLIIGIPAIVTLMMTEISTLHVTVIGYQGEVMLFLMAFMQGLGIDYGKSRIVKAITNN